MKTNGHCDEFIRNAVGQGIQSFDAKIKRSLLDPDHPGYSPLIPKAGWSKDLKSREKALKRGTWYRGTKEDEPWKTLPISRSSGRVCKKKKIFQRAGRRAKPKSSAENATVVFVPSTRGSILIQSLKAEEDQMAELTGFRVKYQEAGDCPPCTKPEGRGNCKARSIVYKSKCGI